MFRWWQEYLSPDGEGSGGGPAPTPVPEPVPPAPTPQPQPTPVGDDDEEPERLGGDDLAKIAAAFQALLERKGNNAGNLAEDLYRENYQYRERNRRLSTEVNQLKARLPEGALVLHGDDLKAYQAYQTLGKPDEVATLLQQQKQQAAELQGLQRRSLLRQVADATGYQAEVLETLALDRPQLTFEIEQTEVGSVAHVSYPNGEATEKKTVLEYAGLFWKAFLPSLQPQGGPRGNAYPAQRVDDKATKRGAADTMIENRYTGPLKKEKEKAAAKQQ